MIRFKEVFRFNRVKISLFLKWKSRLNDLVYSFILWKVKSEILTLNSKNFLKSNMLKLKNYCIWMAKNKSWCEFRSWKYVCSQQGCILLAYLSVISSKFIQKFAQKCPYFTIIDQSVPLDNFYITFYLRKISSVYNINSPWNSWSPHFMITLWNQKSRNVVTS